MSRHTLQQVVRQIDHKSTIYAKSKTSCAKLQHQSKACN